MKKVVIGSFGTETNTFIPAFTEFSAFGGENIGKKYGVEHYRDKGGIMGSFVNALETNGGIEVIPVLNGWAEPWGPVRRAVYDFAERTLLDAIQANGPIDGVVLWLHGAMVLEDDEDAEGLLLEAVRRAVGPAMPIMVTLDLHANVTEKMLSNASALFLNDCYPHTDTNDRCAEAARALLAVLDGNLRPVMRSKRLPMLADFIPTTDPRIGKFVELAAEMEKDPRVVTVSVAYGFFCADIAESGVRAIAVTNNAPELAQQLADTLADAIWAERRTLTRNFIRMDDAIDALQTTTEGPYVFADCYDNPGGGSTGSSTHILRRLIERGVKGAAVASIYDPETVAQAEQAGVGNRFEASLGGKLYPEILGGPVIGTAYVKAITDGRYSNRLEASPAALCAYGKNAVLVLNDVEIIVNTRVCQTFDPDQFRANGIDPLAKRVLVVKSTAHFRHKFEPIGKGIFEIAADGFSWQKPADVRHIRCPRPIWPLDDI